MTYSVFREFVGDNNSWGRKDYTTEELKQLYTLLQCEDGSELGWYITGMNDDEYSDNCSDIVREYYEEEGDIASVVYMLCDKRLSDIYDNCKTYLRCMNLDNLSDTEFEKYWRECTSENCPLD
jgi:hypothetical protein